jgi:hypothetical protein
LASRRRSKYRRQFICDFNYGKFKGEAYEAKGLAEEFPREAKEKVKETQRAMKGRTMDRWQFDEINAVLDEAYRTPVAYYAGVTKLDNGRYARQNRANSAESITCETLSAIFSVTSTTAGTSSVEHDRRILQILCRAGSRKNTTRSVTSRPPFASLRTPSETLITSSNDPIRLSRKEVIHTRSDVV